MARPWTGHWRTVRPGRIRRRFGSDVHRLLPVLPVFVGNLEGDWRTGRASAADAGDDQRPVGFDCHPPAATVAPLSACQVRRDHLLVDSETRGHALENRDERLAV